MAENGAGRPLGAVGKHKPFKAALERRLGINGTNPKELDDIVAALALKASRGDVMAAQIIIDRMDGKLAHTVGQSDEHGPISIVVTGVRTYQDIIDAEANEPKLINGGDDNEIQ